VLGDGESGVRGRGGCGLFGGGGRGRGMLGLDLGGCRCRARMGCTSLAFLRFLRMETGRCLNGGTCGLVMCGGRGSGDNRTWGRNLGVGAVVSLPFLVSVLPLPLHPYLKMRQGSLHLNPSHFPPVFESPTEG
jgi:hypothetical protein